MESLGLVSMMFFAGAATYMLIKWPGDPAKTFSQNAARQRSSIYYYGAIITVFLALLCLFVYFWFIPFLHLPLGFGVVFAVGVAAQMIAGLVPETQGARKAAHVAAATVMYFATLALVGIVATHPMIPHAVRGFAGAVFGLMALLFGVAIFFKRSHRYALVMQVVHLVGFFAVLLLATYIR